MTYFKESNAKSLLHPISLTFKFQLAMLTINIIPDNLPFNVYCNRFRDTRSLQILCLVHQSQTIHFFSNKPLLLKHSSYLDPQYHPDISFQKHLTSWRRYRFTPHHLHTQQRRGPYLKSISPATLSSNLSKNQSTVDTSLIKQWNNSAHHPFDQATKEKKYYCLFLKCLIKFLKVNFPPKHNNSKNSWR